MNDDHLDDDDISAALDGERQPHLDACASCRDRFDQLRAAAAAIASPLRPVDPAVRDAAIHRALSTRVVPLHRRPATWVVSAAAALIAALAIGAVLSSNTAHDGGDDLATKSLEAPAADGAATAGSAAAGPTALGDLGTVDGPALDRLVRDRLASPDRAFAGGEAGSSAPVECLSELTHDNAEFGSLEGYGSATVARTAAVVLVFSSDGGRRRIFALARGDCERVLLATTSQP
jgi:anti-sigma factor RsiW